MIEFKISGQGIEEYKQLIKEIDSIFNDARFMGMIAREARRILYGRVKSGFGVSADNLPPEQTKKVKFKPLSVNYINQRNGLVTFSTSDGREVLFRIRKPVLGALGSPARSNLTLSGQMMDSLDVRWDATSFRMYFRPNRRETEYTNEEVADFVSKERPFFAFTDDEFRIIIDFINREIRRRLQRFLR